MSMTSVDAARSRGWRHVYFNSLTIPSWGVHLLAIIGIAITGCSWLGVLLAIVSDVT